MGNWALEHPGKLEELAWGLGGEEKPTECSKRASEEGEEKQYIPREYSDLMEMFSNREYDVLPSHCPMDCAIEILPGAKLPNPKMYSMAPKDMKELRDYIDKNLVRRLIQAAKS